MLRAFWLLATCVLGFICFTGAANAAQVNPNNYDIYWGDLNGDGANDFYFSQKPLIVILHGDIATPIAVEQSESFVVYRNGSIYDSPQLLTLTKDDLAQKLSTGVLHLAQLNSDYFIWGSNSADTNYVLLRGSDASAPGLLLSTSSNAHPTVDTRFGFQSLSAASFANISNRNLALRIADVNSDGINDIVIGSYSQGTGETAYLSNGSTGNSVLSAAAFEVSPATVEPSIAANQDDGIKYHVGTIGGQFRVDESGSATYSVPINLPQGTAGVTPQVSLNYSSGAGVSLLGKGWSLSANSGISRCRQTLSQDNQVKPITWDSTDRFCLDGQRLMLISGTYGDANSTYKTEADSFVKVTAMGKVSDGSGYFTVTAKDGSTTYYGRTNNSKVYNASAGTGSTLSWLESRFEDNMGNGIDFIYQGDSNSGLRLQYIKYAYATVAKNSGNIPQAGTAGAVVSFSYETRPDPASSFVAGYEFKQTQRLTQILVQNSGQEVRRYVLNYMNTTTADSRYTNKISRIERIKECKGANDCLAPVTFYWGGGSHVSLTQALDSIDFPDPTNGKYLLTNFFADVTGNGKQDLVYLMYESGATNNATLSVRVKYADTSLSSAIYFYNKDYSKFLITNLDYNADGRQDLAVYDGTKWKIYLARAATDGTWRIDSSSTQIDPGLSLKETSFMDINSDGLMDAVTGTNYRLLQRNSNPDTSSQAYSFGSVTGLSWAAESTFPGLSDALAGPYPCNSVYSTKKILPTKAADFNGDGVVDFIGDYYQTGTCQIPYSSGNGTPVSRSNLYAVVVSGNSVINYGGARLTGTDITPVDLNADGLSDLVYRSVNDIYYMLNNGAGFNAAVKWASLPSYSSGPRAVPQFMDINGDGATDLVWHDRSVSKIYAHLWGAAVGENQLVRDSTYGAENDSHLLMDISGDGIIDYLKVTSAALYGFKGVLATTGAPIPCHYQSTPGGLQCVGGVPNPSIAVPENEQTTNIYAIDNGLGNLTNITYGTLSNSGHYSTTDLNLKVTTTTYPTGCSSSGYQNCPPTYTLTVSDPSNFYSRLNGGWDLPAGSETLVQGNANKGKPVLEVNGAMPVVIAVESSAPAAGTSPASVNQDAMSRVDYFYGEAKMQASGRGFLGFAKLKTIDAQTGVTTLTTYRQDFPFIGSPLSTVVYKTAAPDAPVMSSAVNDWHYVQNTAADSTKYYQTYIKSSSEQSFDFLDQSLLQTVETSNTYDAYGNLTSSTVTTKGKKAGGSDTQVIKATVNEYGSDTYYKEMGRLTQATVTTTRDSEPSQIRTSAFTYYADGESNGAKGLLKTETVEPDNLNGITTEYRYDGFGNKTQVLTTATNSRGVLETRTVTNNYGTSGRYLVNSSNDLSQMSTINARDAFGNATSATDINGLNSRVFYDSMGSEYLRKDDTGAWSRTEAQFCGESLGCPAGAKYRVSKRVAGGGKSYEYHDLLGRVIRSSKVAFNGALVNVDVEYDNLSRVKRQSEPYYDGASTLYWTETEYDNLSRVIKVTAPDGSVTTSSYAGNSTTVTNALSQTRKETRNGLGQLEKVTDYLGGTIDYAYDIQGGLLSATTTAKNASGTNYTVKVQMCYDEFGRKVAMHDPDKGGFKGNAGLTCAQVALAPQAGWWYYKYDGFGELIEQRDPKSQVVKSYYDQLGRMVGRTDYLSNGAVEGFTQWFYERGVSGQPTGVQGQLTAVVQNTAAGITNAQIDGWLSGQVASCNETGSSCHKTLNDFDVFVRPESTTVYYPGSSQGYTARTQYDLFGRAYRQFDALDQVITDTSGKVMESGVQSSYNTYGYAVATIDIATGRVLSKTLETDVRGQVTRLWRGNGLTSVNTYDDKTGQLLEQKTLNVLMLTNVQDNVYAWDKVGNLSYRRNLSGKPATPIASNSAMDSYNQSESFCYDGLNRLIKTNANTTSTTSCGTLDPSQQDVKYDGHGNITYKKGVGDYVYAAGATAGPHALTKVMLNGVATNYFYDANGNNTSNDGADPRSLTYTTYDMVKRIARGGKSTEFKYGPDRARWQRTDNVISGNADVPRATTTYMGNVERVVIANNNTIEWKRNVAGVTITYKTDMANKLQATDKRYIYTDHLGSVDLITDANGETGSFSKVSNAMSFDAWGARRNFANWSASSFSFDLSSITVTNFVEPITRRGFTGHEMLDDMGIIHMNGRIYDAKLARFLQADPNIDGAGNTQGFNRYSYVKNNPLNAIDPSGFFLAGLAKRFGMTGGAYFMHTGDFIGAKMMNATHRAIASNPTAAQLYVAGVTAVSAYFCGPCSIGFAAMASSDMAYYQTGSVTFALKQGAITAISTAAFYGIGELGQAGYLGSGATQLAAKVVLHGVVGGVMAELQGGSFGSGFMAAGFSAGTAPAVGYIDNYALRVVTSAAIGGTASKISGGKFANGAITAAFVHCLNFELHEAEAKRAEARKIKWNSTNFVKHYLFGNGEPIDLGDVGLGDEFQSTQQVHDAEYYLHNELELFMKTTGEDSFLFRDSAFLRDIGNNNLFNPLYSVGNSWLIMDAVCSGGICDARFYINDEFKEPLVWAKGKEVRGATTYEINYHYDKKFKF